MILGAGVGYSFIPEEIGRFLTKADTRIAEVLSGEELLRAVSSLSAPFVRWEMFLFFAGFCAFCAPVTLLAAGGCFFVLGCGFAAWHQGNCTVAPPILLLLSSLFTAILAYRSFFFWNVLRDRHICRLYPIEHALLFRLCFQFFKIGCLSLACRAFAILLFTFLQ